ncbi:hypothetical protein ACQPYE_17970 [Actinosynnema sp. CA-299493]
MSADTIAQTVTYWIRLAERGVYRLADCDTGVLHGYGLYCRTAGFARDRALHRLIALAQLWAFDRLSARPCRIGRPPWEDRGIDDYLTAATTIGGENTTEPPFEHTMSPLPVWALRMVEDLGGAAVRRRLTRTARAAASRPAGAAALRAHLDQLIVGRGGLPAFTHRAVPCWPATTSPAAP